MGALFGPATGAAWGLSIVILVVLIRVCLIPLFVKQVNAQRKMAQHAPQLAELRKKYKNDKTRLNEETMKFYKENGVNPLAGCLPMIPQMIIFFALFYVLRAIAEWKPGQVPKYGLTVPVLVSAQKATIFGVHLYDKLLFPHTPGMGLVPSIVAAITVALSATTTFLTVRQTSKRGLMQTANVDPDNPMAGMQKYMMYIVPFFSLTSVAATTVEILWHRPAPLSKRILSSRTMALHFGHITSGAASFSVSNFPASPQRNSKAIARASFLESCSAIDR